MKAWVVFIPPSGARKPSSHQWEARLPEPELLSHQRPLTAFSGLGGEAGPLLCFLSSVCALGQPGGRGVGLCGLQQPGSVCPDVPPGFDAPQK